MNLGSGRRGQTAEQYHVSARTLSRDSRAGAAGKVSGVGSLLLVARYRLPVRPLMRLSVRDTVVGSGRGRGGIFISYRPDKEAPYAAHLYYQLCDRFGEDRVFMNVNRSAVGSDFTSAIKKRNPSVPPSPAT
jgi:hypothetical protein